MWFGKCKLYYTLGVTALALGGICPANASDWAQWRGPNRNGISDEKNLNFNWSAQGPEKLWQANIGKSYSGVVVSKGRLYTVGEKDGQETVYCFQAETGNPLWKRSYAHGKREWMPDPERNSSGATPVVDGDRIYTLSREGLALCLAAKDGKILWQRDLQKDTNSALPQFGFTGSPVVEGDRVYYNAGHHGAALDKKTGAVIWKSEGEVAGYATPVFYQIGKQKGIAFSNGSGVVGVDSATGKPFWEHKWETRFNVNATDPIFNTDGFFITAYGRSQRVRLAENATTSVVYENKMLQTTFVCPVLIDGHLYGNGKGRLVCVNWETGKTNWDVPGMGDGTLIAAGKYLITLLERGELVIARATPEKYTEVARAKVLEDKSCTQPALANGLLYVRNNAGDLICLNLRK